VGTILQEHRYIFSVHLCKSESISFAFVFEKVNQFKYTDYASSCSIHYRELGSELLQEDAA